MTKKPKNQTKHLKLFLSDVYGVPVSSVTNSDIDTFLKLLEDYNFVLVYAEAFG